VSGTQRIPAKRILRHHSADTGYTGPLLADPLESTTLAPFTVGDQGLSIEVSWGGFSAGSALPPSRGAASALPDVRLPGALDLVAGRSWEKTNALDLYHQADAFTVDRVGRFSADFRSSQCKSNGTLSYDNGKLWSNDTPNQCDTRGGSAQFIEADYVTTVGEDILFGDLSYRPAGKGGPDEFFFGIINGRVHGQFVGPLRAGVSTLFALTYERWPPDPYVLNVVSISDVSITMTIPPPNGSQLVGVTTPLASKHFGSVALTAGAPFEDSVAITPPASGEGFMLNFTVVYTQGGQDVTGFVTSVAP
jgi:hypothetical protein